MSSAQDHKRLRMVTRVLIGGMGNFSPSPFYTKEVDEFCKKYIYQATVDAMKSEADHLRELSSWTYAYSKGTKGS
ncbi:MAG: hypothetical protein ACLS9K_09855 [Lachnospira eligens]